MKKPILKALSVVAIVAGLVVGAVFNGLLAYLGGVTLIYAGLISLVGKDGVLYY